SQNVTDMEAGAHATVAQVEQTTDEQEQLSVNVTSRPRFRHGDVEAGFREADVVLEETYRTGIVHQSYMEPQTVAAAPDALGNLTVWASTQGLFDARSEVAAALGMQEHQVRVVA